MNPLNSLPSSPPGLPPGWIETWDATQQRNYYYHAQTRATQWERPLPPPPPPPPATIQTLHAQQQQQQPQQQTQYPCPPLRRDSSTTYKEAFYVIKPYHNKLPGDYLRLKKDDIVIVEHDKTKTGSSLRYGHKAPYNHQNRGGWFDESCLKKCDHSIEYLAGARYLISSTPLRRAVDLSRSSSGSINSSITSCSSSVETSVRNMDVEETSSTPKVFWMLFSKSGDESHWKKNGHKFPVGINWETFMQQKQGEGNVLLCLSTNAPVDNSWHDVLKAFSNYMIETIGLVVRPTASNILNGIADKTSKNTTSLSHNGKIIGYLYKANSTEEFGKEMERLGHITKEAHERTFGKEDSDAGKIFCLYNCKVNQFVFLGYQFNCNWMSIKDKNLSTGLCAKLLKEGIDFDNPE